MAERIGGVRERIRTACARSGRDPAGVCLVAVSKKFGPDRVREASDNGQTVFGESRIQEARQKIPLCPGHLEWHLVGHLQTNKVREAVRLFQMIHSVDSLKLLEAIDAAADAAGRVLPVCLEVNVSGERSKYGLAPEAVPPVLARCSTLMHIELAGLMTLPPFTEDPGEARPFFRRLRELRDEWQAQTGIPLKGLSMGMSHDFDVAVEEGATWVRVGTLLFGEREKQKEAVPAGEET